MQRARVGTQAHKTNIFAATDIQPGGLIESDVPLNENSIVMPCDKYTVITVMGK